MDFRMEFNSNRMVTVFHSMALILRNRKISKLSKLVEIPKFYRILNALTLLANHQTFHSLFSKSDLILIILVLLDSKEFMHRIIYELDINFLI